MFDGDGREFEARVARADRSGASVTIGAPIAIAPDPTVLTTLVQAVLKGDKMDGVVRDATMAGVAQIVPVVTERSLVGRSVLKGAHERWQRIAVASAKQCGRARLPAIDPPQPLREWLEAPFDGRRLLLAEPSSGEDHIQTLRAGLAGPVPQRVACIVGPEGGWSAVNVKPRPWLDASSSAWINDAARGRRGSGRGFAGELCVRRGERYGVPREAEKSGSPRLVQRRSRRRPERPASGIEWRDRALADRFESGSRCRPRVRAARPVLRASPVRFGSVSPR